MCDICAIFQIEKKERKNNPSKPAEILNKWIRAFYLDNGKSSLYWANNAPVIPILLWSINVFREQLFSLQHMPYAKACAKTFKPLQCFQLADLLHPAQA